MEFEWFKCEQLLFFSQMSVSSLLLVEVVCRHVDTNALVREHGEHWHCCVAPFAVALCCSLYIPNFALCVLNFQENLLWRWAEFFLRFRFNGNSNVGFCQFFFYVGRISVQRKLHVRYFSFHLSLLCFTCVFPLYNEPGSTNCLDDCNDCATATRCA